MNRTHKIGKRLRRYKATAAAQHSKLNIFRKIDKSWDYRLPVEYQAR